MTANKFAHDDASVVVVIGSGAGGGVLASELCRLGVPVVLLEAGKRYSIADFRNDEWFAFQQLSWLDKRHASGTWAPAQNSPDFPAWTVKAVGGTSVHWGALAFRMREHELRARTTYGAIEGTTLVDWPVSSSELAPWYAKAEDALGVTGTHGIPLLPVSNNYIVLHAGAKRAGYARIANDRHAINSRPRDGRPSCLQLGFCSQGCKTAAKWSTLYTAIPQAERTGRLDLRSECTALRIATDEKGRAVGVEYVDREGSRHLQRARVVCLAAGAIETPRLLLLSESSRHPDGLANGSGQVGRNFMKHVNGSVFGLFEKPVHMERGVQMCGTVYDEDGHDPKRGFAGGYLMQGVSLGLPFLAAVAKPGAWGRDFTRFLEQYSHLSGIWLNGEDMPRAGNAITLHATTRDAHGLPVANVHVDEHPNDLALRAHFYRQARGVLEAAGATDVLEGGSLPASHPMGTCRMSAAPEGG
ncbi:MAG TPA: GMC family oxidoreductase, partial [Steroidobacteraceae bacterium]|nr:GMC family oxidoreductase [Steroidobacteraceae bacterium]